MPSALADGGIRRGMACPACGATNQWIGEGAFNQLVRCGCGALFHNVFETLEPAEGDMPRKRLPTCTECGRKAGPNAYLGGSRFRCGECRKDFDDAEWGPMEMLSKPGSEVLCPTCGRDDGHLLLGEHRWRCPTCRVEFMSDRPDPSAKCPYCEGSGELDPSKPSGAWRSAWLAGRHSKAGSASEALAQEAESFRKALAERRRSEEQMDDLRARLGKLRREVGESARRLRDREAEMRDFAARYGDVDKEIDDAVERAFSSDLPAAEGLLTELDRMLEDGQ